MSLPPSPLSPPPPFPPPSQTKTFSIGRSWIAWAWIDGDVGELLDQKQGRGLVGRGAGVDESAVALGLAVEDALDALALGLHFRQQGCGLAFGDLDRLLLLGIGGDDHPLAFGVGGHDDLGLETSLLAGGAGLLGRLLGRFLGHADGAVGGPAGGLASLACLLLGDLLVGAVLGLLALGLGLGA